jgi:hypothetical protein
MCSCFSVVFPSFEHFVACCRVVKVNDQSPEFPLWVRQRLVGHVSNHHGSFVHASRYGRDRTLIERTEFAIFKTILKAGYSNQTVGGTMQCRKCIHCDHPTRSETKRPPLALEIREANSVPSYKYRELLGKVGSELRSCRLSSSVLTSSSSICSADLNGTVPLHAHFPSTASRYWRPSPSASFAVMFPPCARSHGCPVKSPIRRSRSVPCVVFYLDWREENINTGQWLHYTASRNVS